MPGAGRRTDLCQGDKGFQEAHSQANLSQRAAYRWTDMAYAPLAELLAYREKILNDEDERKIITSADLVRIGQRFKPPRSGWANRTMA